MTADNFMWFPDCPVEVKGETEDLVFRDLKAFEVQSFRIAMSMGDTVAAPSVDKNQKDHANAKGVGGSAQPAASPRKLPAPRPVQGQGQLIAPVKFQAFTITKTVDYATPMLYKALCECGYKDENRIRIPTVMFAMRKPGGEQIPYIKFTFCDVVITKIEWDGGGGDKTPTEKITFQCSAMGFQYTRQKSTGYEAKKEREWRWDTAKNKYGLGS